MLFSGREIKSESSFLLELMPDSRVRLRGNLSQLMVMFIIVIVMCNCGNGLNLQTFFTSFVIQDHVNKKTVSDFKDILHHHLYVLSIVL